MLLSVMLCPEAHARMRHESNEGIPADAREDVIRFLVWAEGRGCGFPPETALRVGRLTRALALASGVEPAAAERLRYAAALAEVGMVGFPDAQPADVALATKEVHPLRDHVHIGHRLLDGRGPVFTLAAEISAQHHERWDGQGYPWGRSGRSIALSARLYAVAHFLDAAANGHGGQALLDMPELAVTLARSGGTHFDPILVDLVLADFAKFVAIACWSDPL